MGIGQTERRGPHKPEYWVRLPDPHPKGSVRLVEEAVSKTVGLQGLRGGSGPFWAFVAFLGVGLPLRTWLSLWGRYWAKAARSELSSSFPSNTVDILPPLAQRLRSEWSIRYFLAASLIPIGVPGVIPLAVAICTTLWVLFRFV